jgi:hypothetical protein
MADPQRTVENIRNVLHAGQQPALDAIRALAQEYSDACQEVNRRLARCEEFLRQGLRSEAIHFASAQPNLLDLLAGLDFPERAGWDQVAAHCGLPAAPVFRMETATALNRAYADAAPLQELLKRHRLLALSRAPLGERLAVLRQLAQLDAGNPVWAQDVAIFEQVRVRQLQGEVEELKRQTVRPALDRLQGLFAEVQGIPWRTALPPDLVSTIQTMFQAVSARESREQAEQVVRDLSRAQANHDEPRARALAGQWQPLAQQLALALDDPLAQRAGAALDWLARLDRQQADLRHHQEIVEEFQRALVDPRVSLEDLHEMHAGLARSKQGLPADTEVAYGQRVRQLEADRKRRDLVILLTSCFLGLCVFAGFLVFLLWR